VNNNEHKLSSFSLLNFDAFFSFRKAVVRARVSIIIVDNDNDNTEEL